MLSTNELDWSKSLIGTMKEQGYSNYLIYSESNTNSEYDFYCIFSKSEITSSGLYSYNIQEGRRYKVNSGGYRWNEANSMIETDTVNGNLNIPDYETVYTNAKFAVEGIVQPDIIYNQDAGSSQFSWFTILFILVGIFLLIMAFKLFRRK